MTNPSLNLTELDQQALEEAFPDVDCGTRPYGSNIIVQIRTPRKQSAGGIYVPEESRETEQWNTQVAKVIELGPVAFCNRDTLDPWKEGIWCQPGTFVRCPKYGGDRWQVPVPGRSRNDFALFVLFKDLDIVGEITGNPLDIVAFI